MKQNLNGLCNLLHEEAERKYPKHQRRINLMKMKKFQNESSTEFLRRIRKNLEVARARLSRRGAPGTTICGGPHGEKFLK